MRHTLALGVAAALPLAACAPEIPQISYDDPAALHTEPFPFGEHRRPGYSVGLTCGGARRAARSSAMICCRHSMPSLVKAVTPSSPTP